MPCKRCGKCCKKIAMLYPRDELLEEWGKARRFKVMQRSDKALMYSVSHICPQLKNGNECKMQDDKPAVCSGFPSVDHAQWGFDNNHCLPKGCGFKWDGERYV